MQMRVERQEQGQGKGRRQQGAVSGERCCQKGSGAAPKTGPAAPQPGGPAYCTAFIMSKIGRYIATTMPPTITPRTTIIRGSMSESRAETATSTSSS